MISKVFVTMNEESTVTTKLTHEAKSIVETPEMTTLNRTRLKIIDNLLEEKEKLLRMDDEILS